MKIIENNDFFCEMNKDKTSPIKVKDLLSLIPLELLETKAQETGVDRNVKKLFGKDMFLLILMSILDSERVSLRVMEDLYKSHKFRLMAGLDHSNSTTRFTSLSDRLMNINSDFFKELFEITHDKLLNHFNDTEIKKYNIIRFDSTTISASAKLLKEGMVNGLPNKKTNTHLVKQLKITIGFDGLFTPSVNIYSEQKHLAEDVALGETIKEYTASGNDIVVFDRGLKKRAVFATFSEQQKLFVTRINPTKNFKILSSNPEINKLHSDTLEYISDQEVYLYHQDKRLLKVPFRLIIVKKKNDQQTLFFLTNIKDKCPSEIAEIYKSRWDIEVFFRFLKQELNLKHFTSYNPNGIKVVLYIILIAAMLIMIYKKLNKIDSYKRAKKKFINSIEIEITRLIVEICGGNPDATPYLNST